MPEFNGAEAIRALKVMNLSAKIIVLSGHLERFREELEGLEVDAILEKPISLDEIRRVATDLLQEREKYTSCMHTARQQSRR